MTGAAVALAEEPAISDTSPPVSEMPARRTLASYRLEDCFVTAARLGAAKRRGGEHDRALHQQLVDDAVRAYDAAAALAPCTMADRLAARTAARVRLARDLETGRCGDCFARLDGGRL